MRASEKFQAGGFGILQHGQRQTDHLAHGLLLDSNLFDGVVVFVSFWRHGPRNLPRRPQAPNTNAVKALIPNQKKEFSVCSSLHATKTGPALCSDPASRSGASLISALDGLRIQRPQIRKSGVSFDWCVLC